MKFCPNCGNALEDNALFCSSCGSPCEKMEAENAFFMDEEEQKQRYKDTDKKQTTEYHNFEKSGFTSISVMSKVAYVTIYGALIALIFGDRKDSFMRFHINQGLVLNLVFLLSYQFMVSSPKLLRGPFLILAIYCVYGIVIGIKGAAKHTMRAVPYLGAIKILR